jgi:hypothetical protein
LVECLKRYRRRINQQTKQPEGPLHDEYSHGADAFRGLALIADNLAARIVGGTTAPAAVSVTLNLRDGATGAGTVLASWTFVLAGAIAAKDEVILCDLNIVGTANTAMTLEFSAAGGANTLESVNLVGYSLA